MSLGDVHHRVGHEEEARRELTHAAAMLQAMRIAVLAAEGEASAPSPDDGREGRGDTSDQGVTVTVVLEGVQLLVSLVSTTVFGPSAQASRK